MKILASVLCLCFSISLFSQVERDAEFYGDIINPPFVLAEDLKLEESRNALLSIDTKNDDVLKSLVNVALSASYLKDKNYDSYFHFLEIGIAIADKTPSKLDDAYALKMQAVHANIIGNSQDVVKYTNESLKLFRKIPKSEIFLVKNYFALTLNYSRLRVYSEDYKNAVESALEHVNKTDNAQFKLLILTEWTIFQELVYNETHSPQALKKLFDGVEQIKNIVDHPELYEISTRSRILAYNNSANFINLYPYKNMSKEEKTAVAEQHILHAIDLNKQHYKLKSLEANTYLTYGEILLSKGKREEAEKYLLAAYNGYNKEDTSELYLRREITNFLAKFYQEEGDYKKALFFKDESLKYSKEAYKIALDDQANNLQASYNHEKKNEEIANLKEKNKFYARRNLLYIGIILAAFLGLLFMFLMLKYKQKLNLEKTNRLKIAQEQTELQLELEQKEKDRLKIEQEFLSLQQEHLKKQAMTQQLQLHQKATFINKLNEKVNEESEINLQKILKEERLMDYDFNIHNLLKDIHPEFFKKLEEVAKTKLTNLDIKYASFIYLNIDSQQIAKMMNVELTTVRMNKYRLKQKLNIGKEQHLGDFIRFLV